MDGAAEPAKAAISPIFPFALKTGHSFALDTAKATLDSAGWRPGSDGVRVKDGTRLAFTLLTYASRPELNLLAVALQAQWKALGAAVDIRQVDQINDALKDPSFEASLYATNTAPTGDPATVLSLYYRTGAPSNYGKFSSALIDDEIAKLVATSDPAQRNDLARTIQQDLLDESPHLYLVVPKFIVGLTDRLKDYEPFPSDYYILDNQLRVHA
jgi:peptide/nickel transport system substrate-binding protein